MLSDGFVIGGDTDDLSIHCRTAIPRNLGTWLCQTVAVRILPGQVYSLRLCPEQAQPWGQTRLLRASPSWSVKPPNARDKPNLLWTWLHAVFVGKRYSPYLQPELVFQLVTLLLTLPPCTTMKRLAAPPPYPTSSAGDAVGCPFSWLNKPQSHSYSPQGKGSSPTFSVASAQHIYCHPSSAEGLKLDVCDFSKWILIWWGMSMTIRRAFIST